MNRRELLTEIDATLDRLIENAAALQDVPSDSHLAEALQKTQESLLAHLLHLDTFLDQSPQSCQDKRALLSALSRAPTARRKLSQKLSH
ncbi:MAG: hypothetical protein KDK64_02850 [Chlamydiia bacterium]|nr:hypothetical protein [Chlamydiia bacterium]